MRFQLIILVVETLGLVLSNEFFPQWKYDQWAADLTPGFIIQQTSSCPRCYCKVPGSLNTTSTTSTSTTTTSTPTTTTSTSTTTTTTSTPTTTTTTSTTTPTTTTSTSTTTTSTPTTTTTTSTPTTTTTTSTPTTTTTSSTSTTSTTTSTPTTTSTTSSTSSTTTSTSTTSTSSSTSTTTTGTTTTTDKNEYWSGNCSMSVTLTDGMTVYWQSPLYDGGDSYYPEGDYCCSCNITIPKSYDMFLATMIMAEPSSIHETQLCQGDQITFFSSSGDESTFCGDIGDETWSEMQIYNGPKKFSYTWCSDTTDGGTDIGFKMTIAGHDLMPSGK